MTHFVRPRSVIHSALRAALLVAAGLCTLVALPRVARATPPAGPASADELAAFVDGAIARQMADRHIPGATFVFVRDGKVLLAKGYGLADVEAGKPMDPRTTPIPVGSLSKPVTAVAVMRLWERGKVRLDEPVATYLPAGVAPPALREVTLHHLLTHTSGFDPVMLTTGAPSPDALLPLGHYVVGHAPVRGLPTGRLVQYTNYNYAVAGYVVERVGGLPFERYMAEQVLRPMGMTASRFIGPGGTEPAGVARGYDWAEGRYVPVVPLYMHGSPAANLRATTTDMGRFLIAQLDAAGGGGVLRPETLAVMHRRQFTHHPSLPGRTYGWAERPRGDVSALEHGGVWTGFTCKAVLLPRHRAGFFVAYNRYSTPLLDELSRDLLGRFYVPAERRDTDRGYGAIARGAPVAVAGRGAAVVAAALHGEASLAALPPRPISTAHYRPSVASLSRFAGRYRPVEYAHGNFEKLRMLWKPAHEVRVSPADAALVLASPGRAPTRLSLTTDGLLFAAADGRTVAFGTGEAGQVTHLFVGLQALERAEWWQSAAVQIPVFLGFFAAFALASAALVVRCALGVAHRFLRGADAPPVPASRWVAAACALLNLAFLAALAGMLFLADQRQFIWGLPPALTLAFRLPVVAGVLTTALVALAAGQWMITSPAGPVPLRRRVRYVLFAGASAAFVPFLAYWNLLGA